MEILHAKLLTHAYAGRAPPTSGPNRLFVDDDLVRLCIEEKVWSGPLLLILYSPSIVRNIIYSIL
jgi:hypothetical protein